MAGGNEYYEDNIKQGKGIVSDTRGSEVLIREVSFSEEESLWAESWLSQVGQVRFEGMCLTSLQTERRPK